MTQPLLSRQVAQTHALLARLEGSVVQRGDAVIIAGDFNSLPGSGGATLARARTRLHAIALHVLSCSLAANHLVPHGTTQSYSAFRS